MTSPWWPTDPSSVAISAPVSSARSAAVLGVAEAEQRRCLAVELVLPDRQRCDPDAAADQQRPAAGAGRHEAEPQRTEDRQLVAVHQLAQPLGPRADDVEQELQLVAARRRAQHRERPRQKRALVGSPAPSLGGCQHVELTGGRTRAVCVGTAQHVVGAVAIMRDDRHGADPEGRQHAFAQAASRSTLGPPSPDPCSACSESTSGSPRRAAMIARAAALAPEIVVMQGIPRVTEAARIS